MKLSHFLLSMLALGMGTAPAQEGPTALLDSLTGFSPAGNTVSLSSPQFYNGCYPIGPKEAVAADFDGDGFKDLAVAKMEGVISVLFWNQGSQGFGTRRDLLHQPVANYDGSDGYRGVAAADLDRDGRMDVMAISPYKGQLYRYRNLGSRMFGAAQPYPLWAGARDCAAGDFDGDGITDLIVGGGDYSTGRNTIFNYRVMQLRGDGAGGFTVKADLIFPGTSYIFGMTGWGANFPKPVFSFAVYRPLSATADEVAVTHAETTKVRFLRANAEGQMEVIATTDLPKPVHQLEAAEIRPGTGPRAGLPALVAAATYSNEIYFTKSDPPAPGPEVSYNWGSIAVAGLPRSVKVADFNADGRKDLAVVHRAQDIVSLMTQTTDMSFAAAEMRPAGRSPREMILEDFDKNGKLDAAVLCRVANSVALLKDFPGPPLLARPGLYPGGAGISSIKIADLNKDGLQDLLVLDAVKHLLVVRLSQPGRKFGPPVSYPAPSGQLVVSDFNGDGNNDAGILSDTQTLTLLAGNGLGGLSPMATVGIGLPGILAVTAKDLTGDGLPEIVVSNWSSLAILRNQGAGRFTETARHTLERGVAAIAFADVDQDGDPDIIAGGFTSFSVLQNDGNLLTGIPALASTTIDFAEGGKYYGTGSLMAGDFNGDGDPDVSVGTNAGFKSFAGGTGASFSPAPGVNPENAPVATSTLEADYDADGDLDAAILCPFADLIAIQFRDGEQFQQRVFNIVGSNFMATGDLDGDGKPDLAGGAEYLWAAYSSGPPGQGDVSEPGLPKEQKVVINEVLAMNDDFPLRQDGNRNSDFVELYNGSAAPVNISGWTLTETDLNNTVQPYTLPPNTILAPASRLVIVYAKVRSPYHTGFKLTGDGSVITLRNAQNEIVDNVALSPQTPDVSYARPSDAYPAFVKNVYPDPGDPNLYNGNPGPDIWNKSFDIASVQPGQPIVFRTSARADRGISRMQVSWRVLGQPLIQRWVTLYDDGRHDDGLAGDGSFAGAMEAGLPAGTEIEFFYEASDPLNNTRQEPDSPLFTLPGRTSSLFTLKVPDTTPAPLPLEVSEVVSNNSGVVVDEAGDSADYLELRNISQAPVTLSRYSIRSTLLGTGDLEYLFPQGAVLPPGETILLWADGEVDEGPGHMPFAIEKNGDRLYIVERTGTAGTNTVLSTLDVPRLPDNTAWIRLGPGGPWNFGPPSPGRPNADALGISLLWEPGGPQAGLLFPTVAGREFTLQSSGIGTAPGWMPLMQATGTGFEQFVKVPITGRRGFFRVMQSP